MWACAVYIPRTEEPGGLQSMGLQSRTRLSDWAGMHVLQLTNPTGWDSSSASWTIIRVIKQRWWRLWKLPLMQQVELFLLWLGLGIHVMLAGRNILKWKWLICLCGTVNAYDYVCVYLCVYCYSVCEENNGSTFVLKFYSFGIFSWFLKWTIFILYWIGYNIASVLCFVVFLLVRGVRS